FRGDKMTDKISVEIQSITGLRNIRAMVHRPGGSPVGQVLLCLYDLDNKYVTGFGVGCNNVRVALNRLILLREQLSGIEPPSQFDVNYVAEHLAKWAQRNNVKLFDHPHLETSTLTGLENINLRACGK